MAVGILNFDCFLSHRSRLRTAPAVRPSIERNIFKSRRARARSPLLIQIVLCNSFVESGGEGTLGLCEANPETPLIEKGPAITNSRSGDHQYMRKKKVRQTPIRSRKIIRQTPMGFTTFMPQSQSPSPAASAPTPRTPETGSGLALSERQRLDVPPRGSGAARCAYKAR